MGLDGISEVEEVPIESMIWRTLTVMEWLDTKSVNVEARQPVMPVGDR